MNISFPICVKQIPPSKLTAHIHMQRGLSIIYARAVRKHIKTQPAVALCDMRYRSIRHYTHSVYERVDGHHHQRHNECVCVLVLVVVECTMSIR